MINQLIRVEMSVINKEGIIQLADCQYWGILAESTFTITLEGYLDKNKNIERDTLHYV